MGKHKIRTKKKRKRKNLVYMAKPIYGGWVSFTAHLSHKFGYPLYKIGNRTEKKQRDFGYGIQYQNLSIQDVIRLPNLLITALDNKYYHYLPHIKRATIVIHDPTELKPPVLEALRQFQVITIRKSVHDLLLNEYHIANTFLYHPFYAFPKNVPNKKSGTVAISRVDFDKHTDIILRANRKLHRPVQIYGAINRLYVYHKLKQLDFQKYYKGKFDKSFTALNNLLGNVKYVVDLSVIKHDGGGSQYTFLEAIYLGCALILNKKWVDGMKTPFKNGVNCFIIEDEHELVSLLHKNPATTKIIANAKKLLTKHIQAKGW